MLDFTSTFIETQFPVAKLSAEAYKERKAVAGQTLTGLGKWWGRKPLVLVRAVLLGLLLPASDDPRRDMEIFLQLMTMDAGGLWRRKDKATPADVLLAELQKLPTSVRRRFVEGNGKPRLRTLTRNERAGVQRLVFEQLPYSQKLEYCRRPEQIDGPSPAAWDAINAHLGTHAQSLAELVAELGEKRFGRRPRVGDAFCGGGAVPFEAARLGCDVYASDLNPVAALLTWAALHIVGGAAATAAQVQQAQADVFRAVGEQITTWRIEHNALGWRADAYLYCSEATCPECGRRVPLAPAWVIAEKYNVVAELRADADGAGFAIDIVEGASAEQMQRARTHGTVRTSRLHCPACGQSTPIEVVRRGLRLWENHDLVPRPDDVFQERLYCIRWTLPDLEEALCLEQAPDHVRRWSFLERCGVAPGVVVNGLLPLLAAADQQLVARARAAAWSDVARAILTALEARDAGDENAARRVEAARRGLPAAVAPIVQVAARTPARAYRAPDAADLRLAARARALLRERFDAWQAQGYLPARAIEPGEKTDEPIRTRGWTHWHHLFTPRQLLIHGLLSELIGEETIQSIGVAKLLSLGTLTYTDSKLCRWRYQLNKSVGIGAIEDTFSNQALNTIFNFPTRSAKMAIEAMTNRNPQSGKIHTDKRVSTVDARHAKVACDLWITDPPYADAVNYHELSEFFLAWYDQHLQRLFPAWYVDSKRALAIRGDDPVAFRQGMVAAYRNLTAHMPDDGFQVVMFTHQDAAVWADLTMILWAAGLRVTAAWTIATETDTALREGNYVQGTVLLVCRKRTSGETLFLDELAPQLELEVKRQLETMLAFDDASDPNFGDADYQLAAYTAALRVLTAQPIEDIDPQREINRVRAAGEENPIERLIRSAVKIACDHLVPRGLDSYVWKTLTPLERLYLKGLELEAHGEYRNGVYQELARGFGATEYTALLADTTANRTRLKTPAEFGRRMLGGDGFGGTPLRQTLFAIYLAQEDHETPRRGLDYLKSELPDYWEVRERISHLLDYLARLRQVSDLAHWRVPAERAEILLTLVRTDHV
jgi:adenine-specific DNA methylase